MNSDFSLFRKTPEEHFRSLLPRLLFLLIVAIMLLASSFAVKDAEAQTTKMVEPKPIGKMGYIPIMGKTEDGKYYRYGLDGMGEPVIEAHKYLVGKSTILDSGYVFPRIGFLSEQDAEKNPAYKCENICIDKSGYVVGIHPGFKGTLKLVKEKVVLY